MGIIFSAAGHLRQIYWFKLSVLSMISSDVPTEQQIDNSKSVHCKRPGDLLQTNLPVTSQGNLASLAK